MRAWILAGLLVLAAVTLAPTSAAREVDDCYGKPGMAGACLSYDGNACASGWFGFQGAWVCAGRDDPKVCTSAYTFVWGYCPTSIIVWD